MSIGVIASRPIGGGAGIWVNITAPELWEFDTCHPTQGVPAYWDTTNFASDCWVFGSVEGHNTAADNNTIKSVGTWAQNYVGACEFRISATIRAQPWNDPMLHYPTTGVVFSKTTSGGFESGTPVSIMWSGNSIIPAPTSGELFNPIDATWPYTGNALDSVTALPYGAFTIGETDPSNVLVCGICYTDDGSFVTIESIEIRQL